MVTPSGPVKPQGTLDFIHLDLPLLIGLLLLCGFGLVVLYSATGQDMAQVQKQLVRLAVAFAVMVVVILGTGMVVRVAAQRYSIAHRQYYKK